MKFNLTKHEIKKNIILNATYKCVSRQGIAEISMRSIAKEAKINQSNLHYYFKSRENLLIEFIKALFERFKYDITKTLKPSDPPAKKLDSLLQAAMNHLMVEKEMYVVFAELWSFAINSPATQQIFADLYKDIYRFIDTIIMEGIKEGVFKDERKDVIGVIFLTFVEGLGLIWHMRKQSFSVSAQFELFAGNLRKMVLREVGTAP
jgi:AcrR family transcriptional regulator